MQTLLSLIRVKNILKATIIKTVWHWHKYRNIDKWNKIETPKINPHTLQHLTFDKGDENIQWRKVSSISVGKTG